MRSGPFLAACQQRALRGLLAGLARLSPRAGWMAGGALGLAAWLALGRRRRIALANLERVLGGELGPQDRRRIARAMFLGLGRHLVDFARLPRLDAGWAAGAVTLEGAEHFHTARRAGRPVVYVTAHFGSWELMPHVHAWRLEPVAVIARPADHPGVEAIVRARREGSGNLVIEKRHAIREALAWLRRGGIVGILVDQHVPRGEGVPGEFLGQPVDTTPAAALLARRSGAALLPVAMRRTAIDRYHMTIGAEIEVSTSADLRRDLAETTQRINRSLERWIRMHPAEWLWIHRRFRPD